MIFNLIFISLISSTALALQLEYMGEASLPRVTKFQGTTVGGLSAIVWSDGKLFALSDDRGKVAESRFYEFDLQIQKKTMTFTPTAVHFLSGVPSRNQKKTLLDPEGLVRLAGGDFLISSEGDTNSKPREMPRLFRVTDKAAWKNDFDLPEKFLPEPTGQQKKGVRNNLAFEGLTSTRDGKVVFMSTESALVQDTAESLDEKSLASGKAPPEWIRIIKFSADSKADGFKAGAEFAYPLDELMSASDSKEVFRGVTEILALSETKLIVLERGVRISPKNLWTTTGALYVADLSKASDVSGMKSLVDAKFVSIEKKKLIDFELDLTKQRANKPVQNFEGLSWGPLLADGRKSLLMISDDNFSKNELTELLLFAVEGE